MGLIRRIGEGRTTEIWHDQWIEGAHKMKPLGRASEEPVQLVSDLIMEDSNQWDVEKVNRVFFPVDAAAILSMPRPRRALDDFWAWAWDRSGVYTVRSTYKELVQRGGPMVSGVGSSTNDEATWRSLWRLRVMPKIRVFWWRVVKGLLPVAGELKRRHIQEQSNCPLCGHDDESLFHALTECEHAKQFWCAAQDFFGIKLPRLHPVTWARDVLDGSILKKKDAAIAVSVMWAIWSSRNNYNHGETQYQPLRSMELVHEFIKSMDIPSSEEPAPLVEVAKWKRPTQGWVKINSDGAIDQHANLAGAGVVARDSLGAFVAAECRKYDYIADPRMAELLACRDAVALAHSKGWSHVELETRLPSYCFSMG